MFKKQLHKRPSDVNVYAARRLRDMARSMDVLAKTFGKSGADLGLTKDDGIAAMEAAAAMVCGNCTGCGIQEQYVTEDDGENYYLYYLLRTFEKKGSVDYEDMPRCFLEVCRRKTDYLGHLNRNLGRATMNLTWKNRFLESRDAVMIQFEEMAGILEEFSGQIEQASDVTEQWESELRSVFRKRRVALENILVLEYNKEQREVFFSAKTTNGKCLTVKEAAVWIGRLMKGIWCPSKDGRTLITRQMASYRFVEDGAYRVLFGAARMPKSGEEISGDSYTFKNSFPGQALMSLSDGMGCGPMANEDSEKVIELTEQLLETGFSPRAVLKLVNTVLLLTGHQERPATMDLCLVDLYSGAAEIMKLGASASFIMGVDTVEILEADHVPAGILNPVEPMLLSVKIWDRNKIVMVSDGILDIMPGEKKEEVFRDFLAGLPEAGPQETAEMILTFALSLDGEPRDDMTVLVGGIYGR